MIKNNKKIIIIISIVIASIILIVLLSIFLLSDDTKKKIGNIIQNNGEKEFNDKIVKTFLPESKAAFIYASPMLYNNHIYIGTSERTGSEDSPISKISDNFF